MVYVTVYSYLQPYKKFCTNILETVLLVDLILMLAIASIAQLKVKEIQFYNNQLPSHCSYIWYPVVTNCSILTSVDEYILSVNLLFLPTNHPIGDHY